MDHINNERVAPITEAFLNCVWAMDLEVRDWRVVGTAFKPDGWGELGKTCSRQVLLLKLTRSENVKESMKGPAP